jgi:hypothetical protein
MTMRADALAFVDATVVIEDRQPEASHVGQ